MLKASALYMVIVIALVISVLCSAVIVAGYYYKSVYLQNSRYDQLSNNLESGVNILITNGDQYQSIKTIDLYDTGNDSLTLQQYHWGLYDIGIVRSFIQKDTLTKVFSLANTIDSTKWSAIYLIDEDRPLSVSGKTHIQGTVFIPKAGIKEAYVNNHAYEGDKRIVIGTKKNSGKALPPLLESRLQTIHQYFNTHRTTDSIFLKNDSTSVSFLTDAKCFNFKKKAATLSNIALAGHVILFSDTTITIDNTAKLENVLIFAKGILVESGFNGNCQLFATDSIHVGKHCQFNYPSCLALLPTEEKNKLIPVINIDDASQIKGIVFTSTKNENNSIPVITIGSNTTITGQIYAQGLLNLKDNITIYGSVFTNRFTYQTSYTHYENYLININIDVTKLSPYYLPSNIVPVSGKKKKILQWLQ